MVSKIIVQLFVFRVHFNKYNAFQLIINEARMKVAVALSEGKAININGGNYISCHCDFCCFGCEKGNNGRKRREI